MLSALRNLEVCRFSIAVFCDIMAQVWLLVGPAISLLPGETCCVGNVHQVAQAANPAAGVVYVDVDPLAVRHSLSLLEDEPGRRFAWLMFGNPL